MVCFNLHVFLETLSVVVKCYRLPVHGKMVFEGEKRKKKVDAEVIAPRPRLIRREVHYLRRPA